jgi:hypothetical protein
MRLMKNGKHITPATTSSDVQDFNSFFLGGAIFYPVDGKKDADIERSDGGGGAVLYDIADRTAAAYDGRMIHGQNIVKINLMDVSSWSFHDIAEKIHSLHNQYKEAIENEERDTDNTNGDGIPEGRILLSLRDPDDYSNNYIP